MCWLIFKAVTSPAWMCSLILIFVDINAIKFLSLVNSFVLSFCNYETINNHFNAIFVKFYQRIHKRGLETNDYSKTCVKPPLKHRQNKGLNDN